jgi:hypothetical protein
MASRDAASRLFRDFHRFDPREVGEFDEDLVIPEKVYKQGKAINVMYWSDKTDPETLTRPRKQRAYIHDHESGVNTYLVEGEGKCVEVPSFIRKAEALVLMGPCIGFTFVDPNGDEISAECKDPLPELYATPNGRALLVIERKREIVAITWGGALGVEPRGIVG